ncbi:MAG: VOC family protein [Chloroflexota bacterium]
MSPLVQTKKLSHLALTVSRIEEQTAFYRDIVGLHVQNVDTQGRVYLRCQSEHHDLLLIPSEGRGMDHFALDVGGMAELDAAAQALEGAGIHVSSGDERELGHGHSYRFLDPDGFVVELVSGMEQAESTYGPRVVRPRRYGHLTLRVTDLKQTVEFYTDLLGFRISDWLGEQFCWLRCTPEHHGLALSTHERAPMMHHLAFHVRDMAELVQQAEYLMQQGRILLYGPGRHGPGQNLFIYFHDEEENIVEFAADMQRIWDEENYQPKVWDPNERWSNMWGPPSLPEFRK